MLEADRVFVQRRVNRERGRVTLKLARSNHRDARREVERLMGNTDGDRTLRAVVAAEGAAMQ